MPRPKAIAEPKQLLVEGRSPELFCSALLAHINLTGIQLQDYGGITELHGFLKALRLRDRV